MALMECSDGKVYDVLPPGTRVRDHKGNTGRIKCIEMHESGRPSPVPYNIDWDDNQRARETRGWFWIYGSTKDIVEEE